ncbi:MAG: sulfurtransferase [Kastovskya adunca ATA6-11-RM4]|jgi:thiosulfate/3-mercaptopyruvate sulfurtransferase|nr:sulfurtransferase [Kastovskya adunca ATA6-11-RM4]
MGTNVNSNPFLQNRWVVSAELAKRLIEQGATVLDVRNPVLWLLGHVPGAVQVNWQRFSQKKFPNQGKLIDDVEVLAQKLRSLGICNDKPVIVAGNPARDFGEEGRIVWMLRTLGHSRAAFVDGGYPALMQVGVPIVWELTQPTPGDFTVKRSRFWEIQRDELQAQLSNSAFKVIDTRSPCEYAGLTIYGEKRGGHIPRAVPFYFRTLLDNSGYLLPREQILETLKAAGIETHTPVATYCTGGVRSGFFLAVLADLGFTNVKNYAGSMWEWSATATDHYPLEKSKLR